jgi:hypothetical protein
MATLLEINVTDMVLVVGDILSFSTIAESADDRVLLGTSTASTPSCGRSSPGITER